MDDGDTVILDSLVSGYTGDCNGYGGWHIGDQIEITDHKKWDQIQVSDQILPWGETLVLDPAKDQEIADLKRKMANLQKKNSNLRKKVKELEEKLVEAVKEESAENLAELIKNL